jgi:hypothetical protein
MKYINPILLTLFSIAFVCMVFAGANSHELKTIEITPQGSLFNGKLMLNFKYKEFDLYNQANSLKKQLKSELGINVIPNKIDFVVYPKVKLMTLIYHREIIEQLGINDINLKPAEKKNYELDKLDQFKNATQKCHDSLGLVILVYNDSIVAGWNQNKFKKITNSIDYPVIRTFLNNLLNENKEKCDLGHFIIAGSVDYDANNFLNIVAFINSLGFSSYGISNIR